MPADWFKQNAPPNAPQPIDYAALAQQARSAVPAPVDYAALADQARRSAPGVGEDVSHMMGGGASAPGIGEDVSHLMGASSAPDWFDANAPGAGAVPSSFAEKIANAAKMIGTTIPNAITGGINDVVTGVAKGAGQTATNLGALVHKIPGVDTAVDTLYGKPGLSKSAFAAANEDLTATNTAQKMGKFGEQIAETFAPGKAITAAGKGLSLAARMALEGSANATMAAAQGGDPLTAGAIGAVLPGAGAWAGKVAPALRDRAEQQVVQALGPRAQRYKAMAERITPEILKRGLRGSREALQAQAADAASSAGEQIDQAIQQFGDRQVGTQPIAAALEEAKNAFRTVTQQHVSTVNPSTGAKVLSVGPNGVADVLHEFEPRAIQQLDGLQKIVQGLGPDARADQLIAIRRAWDGVVNQAGGYAHRAPGGIGMPLADQSEAWAKRQATTAIRQQLDAAVPELSGLNKEFSFWKNLDSVLTQTLQRTQPQRPGLGVAAAKAAGHVVGGVVGASTGTGPLGAGVGAIVGGRLNGMLEKAFTSPAWKLASAQRKDRLASAIANNDLSGVATALMRITAVQGSKIPAAVAGQ